MAICQDILYYDVINWLPQEQLLEPNTIRKINKLIVNMVGDDDEKYPEVLCKALEANARKNQIEYRATHTGLKREKSDKVEVEYFQISDSSDVWEDYIRSLENICPMFGYNKPYTLGIKLSSGKTPKISDCCYLDSDYIDSLIY